MPRRGSSVRTAFIVTADGRVSAIDPSIGNSEAAALWEPLDAGRLTGVAVLAGRPRQLVAAPIMAPTLIGWVVFAADLDDREMRSLERLVGDPAARRGARQEQRPLVGGRGQHVGARAGTSARLRQNACAAAARRSKCASGARTSIALAKPLPAFSATRSSAILLLAYPKAEALADARKLQLALAVMTLLGLILVALRDVAGGRANHAAARPARRSRRPAGGRRACPGAGARRR